MINKAYKSNITTESQEQIAIVKYCDLKKIKIFHIPNGSYKSLTARIKSKQEGLRAGVPDLMIPIPISKYHGLFIELKRRDKNKSKVSENQKKWINDLNNLGYLALVCYGANEAIKSIEDYLNGKI